MGDSDKLDDSGPDRPGIGLLNIEIISMSCSLSWSEWPDASAGIFEGLRSDAGEEMILEKNLFVEAILPGSILRELTEEEMNEYRRPFASAGEARRPTLTWPRQIPLGGEPA